MSDADDRRHGIGDRRGGVSHDERRRLEDATIGASGSSSWRIISSTAVRALLLRVLPERREGEHLGIDVVVDADHAQILGNADAEAPRRDDRTDGDLVAHADERCRARPASPSSSTAAPYPPGMVTSERT